MKVLVGSCAFRVLIKSTDIRLDNKANSQNYQYDESLTDLNVLVS